MKSWGTIRHSERVAEYTEKWVPKCRKSKFLKAHSGRSRAAAIHSKCQECCGFEDVLKNVRFCRSWTCPLWSVRPYQIDGDPYGVKEE